MEIRRNILSSLRRHLDEKEITLITGPRQVGKTTLMRELERELRSRGEKTIFFNLDYQSDMAYFSSQNILVQKLNLEFGDDKAFVFIDEIQRIVNAGIFLKGIYDQQTSWKFIVSGSGSIELKEKIHESLAGRKRIFEMMPVSFTEFIDYKTKYRYSGKLHDYFETETGHTINYLNEYLSFGGYPRLITEKTGDARFALVNEIYSSYITRDITALLNLNRPDAFTRMIHLLAVNIGSMINYSRFSTDTGLSVATLKTYMWYAEKTFVIHHVSPFFQNKRKEITKSPIIYFTDIGLRNFTAGVFDTAMRTDPTGFAFQNFVFMQLYDLFRGKNWTLHFWRTTDKAEVDIVIDKKTEIIPVEVKFSNLKKPVAQRSLQSFIEKYKPSKAYVINLGLQQDIPAKHGKIKFIPFWKMFGEEF